MTNRTRTLATLVAAGSLISLPAVAQGAPKESHGKSGASKACAKTQKVGYSVGGTLVSYTADDAATKDVNESSVVLKVTRANAAARNSGELTGGTYTVSGETVKLHGFQGTDTPSVGDRVKVSGKITRTKKKCAPAGTTAADRYGEADVKKVTISDRDEDVTEQS